MNGYTYPKVPNHYHESVSDQFLENTDVTILEKLDGSNCKIAVYDERFTDLYNDDIHSQNPQHGNIFISTKKTVRGKLTDDLNTFDGIFHRLVCELRETISAEEIFDIHDYFETPLVFFGEHMVRTTLDYDYESNPPPAFIGFDILKMAEFGDQPANPMEQRFDGFLQYDKMQSVFDSLGLPVARFIAIKNTSNIQQTEKELDIEIPESKYTNTQAEGVVLRNQEQKRRVKYVSPKFRERSKKSWSALESECETGAEMFCAKFVTNPRIRKVVMKAVNDPQTETITVDRLTNMVITDIWNEDLTSIMQLDEPIHTDEIYSITAERCETVFDIMQTNASLNNTAIDNVWTDFVDNTDINEQYAIIPHQPENNTTTLSDGKLQANLENIESFLVTQFTPQKRILSVGNQIANQKNKEFGNWVIPLIQDKLTPTVWYENIATLANLHVEYTPTKLTDELVDHIATTITAETQNY